MNDSGAGVDSGRRITEPTAVCCGTVLEAGRRSHLLDVWAGHDMRPGLDITNGAGDAKRPRPDPDRTQARLPILCRAPEMEPKLRAGWVWIVSMRVVTRTEISGWDGA